MLTSLARLDGKIELFPLAKATNLVDEYRRKGLLTTMYELKKIV